MWKYIKLYETFDKSKSNWFKYNWKTVWWYDKFKHSDWSEIQIRPDWEVVRTKRIWKSDWTWKYPQRYDENWNPTNNHNTWEFIIR